MSSRFLVEWRPLAAPHVTTGIAARNTREWDGMPRLPGDQHRHDRLGRTHEDNAVAGSRVRSARKAPKRDGYSQRKACLRCREQDALPRPRRCDRARRSGPAETRNQHEHLARAHDGERRCHREQGNCSSWAEDTGVAVRVRRAAKTTRDEIRHLKRVTSA
jgi:hypothetical protein